MNHSDATIDIGYLNSQALTSSSLTSMSSPQSSIIGVSYGKGSDIVRASSNSDNDLFLPLSANGVVSLFRDGKMISSQYYAAGLQRLEVSKLPIGNYPVIIKIKEQSGREYEVEEFVYNNSSLSDGIDYGLSAGVDIENNQGFTNAYIDAPLGDRFSIGLAGTLNHDGGGVGVTLLGEYAGVNIYSDTTLKAGKLEQNIRLNGKIAEMSSYNISSQYQWGDERSNSNTLRLSHRFGLNGYLDGYLTSRSSDAYSNQLSSGLNVRQKFNILGVEPNLSFGITHQEYASNSEVFYSLGVSLSLFDDNNNFSLRSSSRNVDDKTTLSHGIDYSYRNKTPRAFVSNVAGSIDYDENDEVNILTSVDLTRDYLNGTLYAQANSANKDDTINYGGTLLSNVYLSNGQVGVSKENASSAIIVNVKNHLDTSYALSAFIDGREFILNEGANTLPLRSFEKNNIAFIHGGGYQLSKSRAVINAAKNEVYSETIEVIESVLVVGTLVNTDGTPVGNKKVTNHVSQTYTDENGVFTLNVSKRHPLIIIDENHEVQLDVQNSVNEVLHIGKKII